MDVSVTEAGPLLVIDITVLETRALLFDVVEGRYRFVAQGVAPSTAGAPVYEVGEGVRLALDALSDLTGRVFIGADENLIIPSQPDGNGVDNVVISLAAGPPVRVALAGLLDEVSLQSARHLSETIYGQVVAEIGLNDRRKTEAQIDALLHARPDVLIVTGGTNGGASRSVLQIVEAVGLAVYLAAQEERPEVLYAGNQALAEQVQETLGKWTTLQTAPNVRPALGVEDLQPATAALAELYVANRLRRVPGLAELRSWSGEHITSRSFGFGRVVRFLGQLYDPQLGVLGVEMNALDVTLAAAWQDRLVLGVYPDLGVRDPDALLKQVPPAQIAAWLPVEAEAEEILDFVYNRALHPQAVALEPRERMLEQALGRAILGVARQRLQRRAGSAGLYEPILVSGDIFRRASPQHALQMLLDGIQPQGITTLVMDQHGLLPALGAAAVPNPILTVQVLESSAFFNLATVVSPRSSARPGTPILRFQALFEETGNRIRGEVKAGSLERIPVPLGQAVALELQPLHGAMLGTERGSQTVRVVGGLLGVILDGRGRPVRLPQDAARRRAQLLAWEKQFS